MSLRMQFATELMTRGVPKEIVHAHLPYTEDQERLKEAAALAIGHHGARLKRQGKPDYSELPAFERLNIGVQRLTVN